MTKDCLNASHHLNNLNRQQRRAVTHGVKNGTAADIDPLLVIAGAGSGKTKTLSHRAAHLVVKGMDPRRILLLTFSRHAAEEMTERVKKVTEAALGGRQIELPWSGTFHADRGTADPGICRPDWSEAGFHDPRSARRCRFDEFGSAGPWAIGNGIPIPDEEHLPEHIFVRRQFSHVTEARVGEALPIVCPMDTRIARAFSLLREREASAGCPRLRRPPVALGPDDGRSPSGRQNQKPISIMFS